MKLAELDGYLAEYLKVATFDDESVNGLQVEGRAEVRRLALAVSACAEVFRKAGAAGADAVLVHHGLFWKGDGPKPLVGVLGSRVRLLVQPGLSLLAYHLPLDAHPEVGNNAVAARAAGLVDLEPFCDYHGSAIGWCGRFPVPREPSEFIAGLESYYGHRAHAVVGGQGPIRTAGFVSGGAAREAASAVEKGLDAYVTGEPGEPVAYLCREAGLTFAALGHYATERVGVRALGAHLESAHGLETLFIEVENEA
jgi:dinuclear metal center YbgI/SA1388 family protein